MCGERRDKTFFNNVVISAAMTAEFIFMNNLLLGTFCWLTLYRTLVEEDKLRVCYNFQSNSSRHIRLEPRLSSICQHLSLYAIIQSVKSSQVWTVAKVLSYFSLSLVAMRCGTTTESQRRYNSTITRQKVISVLADWLAVTLSLLSLPLDFCMWLCICGYHNY